MTMNDDQQWLQKMSELEDGCDVSVGGIEHAKLLERLCTPGADPPENDTQICTHQTLRECSHGLHDEYWLTCDSCHATFSYQQAYTLLRAELAEANRKLAAWRAGLPVGLSFSSAAADALPDTNCPQTTEAVVAARMDKDREIEELKAKLAEAERERERVSYFAQIATYKQGDYGYHGPVYRVVIPVDPKASPIPSFIEAADAAREEQKGKTE